MLLCATYLQHTFKQRVWIGGSRPGEEEIYEFTLVQVFARARILRHHKSLATLMLSRTLNASPDLSRFSTHINVLSECFDV